MSWWYCMKEGLDGLLRAKIVALVAAVTLSGALVLMGAFALVTFNVAGFVDSLRARIELEIFVDNARDEAGVKKLQRQLETSPGVALVKYVSREEAAEDFRQAFGEEFIELLASNPLPPSFRISLEKPYQNSVAAQQLAEKLRSLEGVDEVVYRRDFIQRLERYIGFAIILNFLLGALVCLGSVFVVINEVRLVAYAKRRIIETMQLVGASRALVQGPFLLQGFIQGALGATLAVTFFYVVQNYFLRGFGDLIQIPVKFFSALVLGGITLGVLASYLGVRKYVK